MKKVYLLSFWFLLVAINETIAVPPVTITTGTISPSAFCPGASVTVPYTVSGTFHSGNVFSVQLSDSTGAFSGSPIIGSIASLTSGTISTTIPSNILPGTRYRVLVFSSNPSFLGSDNGSNLTIYSVPTATITVSGATTFCSGSSVTLTANSGIGLNYQWKLNSVNINGATSSTYSVSAGGNYTCVVSNSCGTATSNSISVTVNSLPNAIITASGSTTICTGGSVTLTANSGTGITYQWQLNSGNISGATAISYSASSAGNYACVVSDGTCSATSNVISVTNASISAPSSITGSTTDCAPATGFVYTCSTVTGALSYNWTAPANFSIISGQGTSSVTVNTGNNAANGSICVTASNASCVSTATCLNITVSGIPYISSIYAVSNTSGTVSYGCSCSDTLYLEYGLNGFTPGTGITAGNGGTVITIHSGSSYTITGLTPDTYYDVYLRKNCGSYISGNIPKKTFKTLYDCPTAQNINCSNIVTAYFPGGNGIQNYCSSGNREIIYSFTPTVSGTHILFLPPRTNFFIYYSFKAASAGCNNSSWNCIGYNSVGQTSQLSFGPLTAGIQYYLWLAPYDSLPDTTTFRIECPYCTRPANVAATNITPSSAKINYSSGGYSILEYGPGGFIPGTGYAAGVNGTIINGAYSGYVLNGLTSGMGYDVYLRNDCGNNQFSQNSVRCTFYTPSCNTYNYGALGTSLNMYFNGRGYWDNYSYPCYYSGLYGQEAFIKFIPPSSGYFTANIYKGYWPNYYSQFAFVTRPSGACDISGITCPTYNYSTNSYTIGPFNAGTSYDLILDTDDSTTYPWYGQPELYLTLSCPQPSNIQHSNIQPNSINLSWACNCSTTYLEYGPPGFTPGTDSTAGSGGTVTSNITSPYTLSGLHANTNYDIYLRSRCGTYFSANTPVLSQRTAPDCSSATTLSCSSYFQYDAWSYSGGDTLGAWQNFSCLGNSCGIPNVFLFTPPQTAAYSVLVYWFWTGNTGYIYPAAILMKPASGVCNETGWTCMGTFADTGSVFHPVRISLGTLTAGTSYWILVDGPPYNSNLAYSYHFYFRLDCPNVCSNPALTGASQITCSSAQIFAPCNSCFGNVTLEYGLSGFTPGTDSTAGVGGTVISNVIFPYTITGLSAGNSYDVYSRQNCSSLNSFSANSTKISFTTPQLSLLNLKFYTEGYYLSGGNLRKVLYNEGVDTSSSSINVDTVVVELHNSTSPYAVVESYKGVLQTNGRITCNFSCNAAGHSYYIAVKHRNTIQTWSASPVAFAATTYYDFSTGMAKVYSNGFNLPMKYMGGGAYAFYSGDVNQDGTIDASDMAAVDNGASHFFFGYHLTDCNGDGATDIADMAVIENNAQLLLFFARP